MRKHMKKSIAGAAVCLALARVLCLSTVAIDMEGEMISEDREIEYTEAYRNAFEDGEVKHGFISEDAELIYSVPGLMVYETTEEVPTHTATFSTSFYIRFLDESKNYAGGTATVYSGGGADINGDGTGSAFGDKGSRVGESGVSYEPPLLAAVVCGAGYLLCSGLRGYVFKLKRKAV